MQEVLEIYHMQSDDVAGEDPKAQPAEQLFLTLSVAAVSGTSAPRTMCMLGSIQGQQIRILVDSGSSHTFISSQLALKLQGMSAIASPLSV